MEVLSAQDGQTGIQGQTNIRPLSRLINIKTCLKQVFSQNKFLKRFSSPLLLFQSLSILSGSVAVEIHDNVIILTLI